MLLIEWRLGLLLLVTQVPVTLVIVWLQEALSQGQLSSERGAFTTQC